MARVVVVGGGIAGLAFGLFGSRRGLNVVVVEQDSASPPADLDEQFVSWPRAGVAHARQGHNFLGLARRVLDDEAPDLVAAMLAAGVSTVAVRMGAADPPDERGFALAARRAVFEAALRTAAVDAGTEVVAGRAARRLIVGHGGVPVVRGVVLDGGEEITGDVVIDACGRRSPVQDWLTSVGAQSAREECRPCELIYNTRYYRLRDDESDFPSREIPVTTDLGFGLAMAFPADNRTFALALTVSSDDPLRSAARRPEVLEGVHLRTERTAPWLLAGEPINDVATMARIDNRRRSLCRDGEPVAGGLLLLGDASLHTNPTFGRGASLALAQAQAFATLIGNSLDDPIALVAAAEEWTERHLGPWYPSQVAADEERQRLISYRLRDIEPPPPDDPIAHFTAALIQLAATDPVVGNAVTDVANMFRTPIDLARDAEVVGRVGRHMDVGGPWLAPVEGCTRDEFVALATGTDDSG
jgi:flavin-dependent dehydrogenase